MEICYGNGNLKIGNDVMVITIFECTQPLITIAWLAHNGSQRLRVRLCNAILVMHYKIFCRGNGNKKFGNSVMVI